MAFRAFGSKVSARRSFVTVAMLILSPCAPRPRSPAAKLPDNKYLRTMIRQCRTKIIFQSFSRQSPRYPSVAARHGTSYHQHENDLRHKERGGAVKQEMRSRGTGVEEARARIRGDEHTGPTGGLSRGYVQTNLVILPEEYAFDFLKFCIRNPKPCPILEVTDAGSPTPPVMAPDADLRTDVPKYRIYENGRIVEEPTDIKSYWRDDLVSFLIGCSFTFERALLDAGLYLAHLDQGRNVPMYVTNRECTPSGPFTGPMVVSMRPYRADEIPLAVAVSGRYPTMHGAPVHIGDPEALGIRDLAEPEFGDPISLDGDQTPVFWACGVTPQAVAMNARPPFMITHSPGHMFITDRLDAEYES